MYYNSAAVIDADGSLLGVYRKNHIPLNTIFYEKFYFKPGNLGYPVFNTRYGKVGLLICHDRHYPEGVCGGYHRRSELRTSGTQCETGGRSTARKRFGRHSSTIVSPTREWSPRPIFDRFQFKSFLRLRLPIRLIIIALPDSAKYFTGH